MLDANEQNFDESVKTGLVLVDFWAPWCGPCRAQTPILEQLDKSKVSVVKVNTDENPGLSKKFGIMSIPTLIVFKNGQQIKKIAGLHSLEQLNSLIGIV